MRCTVVFKVQQVKMFRFIKNEYWIKTEVLCAKVRYLSIMSVNSLKKLGE